MLPGVRAWAESTGNLVDLAPVEKELEDARKAMLAQGVHAAHKPLRTADAAELVQACPPAQAAAVRDEMHNAPSKGRQRLQARAARIAEVNAVAKAWPLMDEREQGFLADCAGPGAGTLFGEHSREPADGWLQDHHCTVRMLQTLGLPVLLPDQRCGLRRKSGARKGQVCGVPLRPDGRHVAPCCAGYQTRIHNSLVRRLARSLEMAGLRADTEVVQPRLHQQRPDGSVMEARMDLVASRLGGARAYPIDVRTLDAGEGKSMEAEMKAAQRVKQKRYRGQVRPLVCELRGPLCLLGRTLLDDLAAEAAIARPHGPPAALRARRWRRDLEVTLAFEVAEALRAAPAEQQPQQQLR